MIVVQVSEAVDFTALGEAWRDLEARADGSFFQSWSWVGCLAAERFPDPVLVSATEQGRTVALALFNRVCRRFGPKLLYLGESGAPERDCPYVEQNGVLTESGRSEELAVLCLLAVADRFELVLSGINESTLASVRHASSLVRVARSQASPFVDLAGIRAACGDYLATCSANTRQQIRRSDRFYEREGPITLQRADSVQVAWAWLDEMAVLHQATWNARSHPGSFARPFFRRFHRALIETAHPRCEIALLKVLCNGSVIGILYGFVWRRQMLAYQSGFVYRQDRSVAKPGLTCHSHAIRQALADGLDVYDFLAGPDRYKRSLAGSFHRQHWASAGPFWSPRLLLGSAWDKIGLGHLADHSPAAARTRPATCRISSAAPAGRHGLTSSTPTRWRRVAAQPCL